ncbi:uncharacterized protein LOC110020309 [Phalaenopsis equestris]|uniref:uncharacterized protein LOC110020309 n=1 Tax=Phalaenopsis equestris TaxID=78828 RepID=UPI0009E38CF2|nr:uncharacterized protein LOC110020309 [Phalaenopsis equestris]
MVPMERWAGVLKVHLNPCNAGPFFQVAASVLLCPSSNTLAIPSVNAIFFKGDRVEGTGNPVIERLSDSKNIAEILVSKFGSSANAWVVEASTFNGPFAIFREFVPSVNSRGEPKHYDPDGFPASRCIVAILLKSIDQIKRSVLGNKDELAISQISSPKTALFGFSKGGTVINQIVAELAHLNAINLVKSNSQTLEAEDGIFTTSNGSFLHSISEFHYVDVGLNCHGAYLTDKALINRAVQNMLVGNSSLRFLFHGTPRQWFDHDRPWIQKEKDLLVQLLRDANPKYGGRLQIAMKVEKETKVSGDVEDEGEEGIPLIGVGGLLLE